MEHFLLLWATASEAHEDRLGLATAILSLDVRVKLHGLEFPRAVALAVAIDASKPSVGRLWQNSRALRRSDWDPS